MAVIINSLRGLVPVLGFLPQAPARAVGTGLWLTLPVASRLCGRPLWGLAGLGCEGLESPLVDGVGS